MLPILIYYYFLMGLAGAQILSQKRASAARRKIVGFKPGLTTAEENQRLLEDYGIKIKKHLPLANACLCEIDPSVTEASILLSDDSIIEFIEDDYVAKIQVLPSRPVFIRKKGQNLPWGVKKIEAPDAWSRTVGEGVRVGIIDTGIDLSHPDLKDNIKETFGVLECKNIEDDNGHGTHVAGIIAAVDNNIGVIGVAPKAEIYSVKAFDKNGRGQVSDIVEALNWCVEKKVHVINMSFGFSLQSKALERAIQEVYRHNIVMVAAAGNTGKDNSVMYPAKYPEVIAVAASDINDKAASFSSRGPEIDVIAPGVDIPSTYKGGSYKAMSGTSMATPHVTGTVALMLSRSGMNVDGVKARISSTARDIGLPREKQGAGLLNASGAVGYIKKYKGGFHREQARRTEEGD